MSEKLLYRRISKGKSRSVYIPTHLKATLEVHKNTARLDNPTDKVTMTKTNLSHEHLAKGSINTPRVKLDVIQLYLKKTMYGGPDIVNRWKS